MDMQKEREAFERLPEIAERLHVAAYMESLGFYHAAVLNSGHDVAYVNGAWIAWKAAKASAVPDGFKIVSFKQISELVVAVNKVDLMTHTEQKTNEVRLAWQDIASKLQAMIEAAQEQG